MKQTWAAAVVLMAITIGSAAHADTIGLGADGSFTETGPGLLLDSSGVGDLFTVSNTSDPGVKIQSLTINLGPGLAFDTGGGFFSTGGFGAPFTLVNDGGTGASLVGASLHFTDFDPGETVTFSIDVDALLLQVIPGWRFAAGTDLSVEFDHPLLLVPPATLVGSYAGDELDIAVATVSLRGDAQLIPEPGAAALLVVGAIGVIGWPWRRRQRSA